jgi:hypothetical protein
LSRTAEKRYRPVSARCRYAAPQCSHADASARSQNQLRRALIINAMGEGRERVLEDGRLRGGFLIVNAK